MSKKQRNNTGAATALIVMSGSHDDGLVSGDIYSQAV